MKKQASLLKLLCLLGLWLFASPPAHAQCGSYHKAYAPVTPTKITCQGADYLIDGYATPGYLLTPPYSNLAIVSANGGTPSAAASGDTIFLQNMLHSSASYPYLSLTITLQDSCGNADTVVINDYYPNTGFSFFGSYGSYNLCDSSIRTETYAAGLNSFVFTVYNPATHQYDTVNATVTTGPDSLTIHGLQPDIYYRADYKDNCGNIHSSSIIGSLSNYNNYLSGGSNICDSMGIYAGFKPMLNGPFTYIGYTVDAPVSTTPLVQVIGDSISLGRTIPLHDYVFRFLDGCNDTFRINFTSYDNSGTLRGPALVAKGCNTYAIAINTTGGGPYYDAQIESGLVAAIGYTYYPDSLVITGLPIDSVNNLYTISFRDSSCHNRKYASYSLAWAGLSTGSNNWRVSDSCGSGYSAYARLAGVPPYTNFTWLRHPNTPAVSFNGDRIQLSGLMALLNTQDDSLYVFSMTDSCGKTDTFRIPSSALYSTITGTVAYNSGGCSGINNARADIVFRNPYTGTAYTPYTVTGITGAGSPSAAVSGDTVILTSMVADSSYTLAFSDSCGHLFRYTYTALPANTPIQLSVSYTAEGVCLHTPDSSYALSVDVANASYPYTAYLSGPVADTIANMSSGHIKFPGLVPGTYQVKIEDVCHNIQTLNYTLVSAGTLVKYGYANFKEFDGCDSFVYSFSKYLYTSATPAGFTNQVKFKGPYAAYVVRGVDTFWSYNNNTADTSNINISFTFPSLNEVNPLENIYVIDGCNDTVVTNVVPLYFYFNPTTACNNGVLQNKYTISFSQPYNYNFPLRLTYVNGSVQDTSALYVYNTSQVVLLYLSAGESACYNITDTCNTFLGNVCFNGPGNIHGNYYTRICNPATSGPGKGNVMVYPTSTSATNILLHQLSGPSVLPDTVTNSNGALFTNIDTGDYVMVIKEVNNCSRTDTFSVRVEPFLDSFRTVFVPGCLNANKMVVYYYSNQYSPDYHTLGTYGQTYNVATQGGPLGSYAPGDTVYNIPSNTTLYLQSSNSCSADTVISPAYNNPVIGASAGFHCGSGYSIAIMGKNGVLPYTYEILSGSPMSYSAPSQSSNVFTGLPGVSGNTYQVRITDACGNAFTTLVHADSVADPVTETGIGCPGNNYTASADSIPNVSYTWTGPNGFTHTGATLSFTPVQAADTGRYKLYITNTLTGCLADTIRQIDIISCANPLALEGLDLHARWQNDKVQLYWTDADDKTVSYEIQRSANGSSFTTLSAGKKEYYGSQEYHFTDGQPLGRNYYRVKAVSVAGKQRYSGVVEVVYSGSKSLDAAISANGTGSNSTLLVYNCPNGPIDIVVYNMEGALIHRGRQQAGNATVSYALPAAVPAGLYVVRVNAGGQLLTLKWNVTK